MRAILLAAGLGTRLGPLTKILPKCLMPVNGRPLLEYWLRSLDAAGVSEILVNTHHLPQLVRGWLSASRWAGRVRVVDEPALLGTGGTLVANRDFAQGEPLLLVHADNLCDAPLERFIAAHSQRAPGAVMTMMTFATDSPQTCGILELDANGVVLAFHEKVSRPPGNLANAAVYIVEPEVGDYASSLGKDEVDFSTEIIPHFLGRIQTWHNSGYHRDIGTVASLLAAQVEFCHLVESQEAPAADNALAQGAQAQALAESLAEALGLPLVPLGPTTAKLPSGPAVLYLPHVSDLDSAMGLLHKSSATLVGCVAFLETAPPGFSARQVWKRLGLRCIVARIADPAQQSEK